MHSRNELKRRWEKENNKNESVDERTTKRANIIRGKNSKEKEIRKKYREKLRKAGEEKGKRVRIKGMEGKRENSKRREKEDVKEEAERMIGDQSKVKSRRMRTKYSILLTEAPFVYRLPNTGSFKHRT